MATLTVNPNATKSELINEALSFAKYSKDPEAMEYLNSVLEELKWFMKVSEFQVFSERIKTLLDE